MATVSWGGILPEGINFYAITYDKDDDCEWEEDVTYTHGFPSNCTADEFFTEVSEKIEFDELGCKEMTIIWHGQRVRYVGWQRGMKYEFKNEDEETVWVGYFPEWDH